MVTIHDNHVFFKYFFPTSKGFEKLLNIGDMQFPFFIFLVFDQLIYFAILYRIGIEFDNITIRFYRVYQFCAAVKYRGIPRGCH